jgi:hypothetical protein
VRRSSHLSLEQLQPHLLDVPHPRTPPDMLGRQLAALPTAPIYSCSTRAAADRTQTSSASRSNASMSCSRLTAWRGAARPMCGWHAPMPIGCCASACVPSRLQPCTCTFPTPGGKRGIANGACSPRSSATNVRAYYRLPVGCTSHRMLLSTSTKQMRCCAAAAYGLRCPGRYSPSRRMKATI